jgi:hypothetical protein
MERLFPNQKEVFADWFSGEIRVPRGEMIYYIHAEYASEYEEDLMLVFDKGVLVKQYVIDNRPRKKYLKTLIVFLMKLKK